jgi:hypothetical protein
MWRLAMIACGACAISLSSIAQVTQQDQTLQQQLVADSFSITGDAIAQKFNWFWNTTVTYSIVNNSGMNLYLGFMINSATIGSCTSVERATGALMLLPSPRATAYSMNPMQGPPRGAFVPTGGRASGTLVFDNCAAPNPGYPTAPFSVSLMIGRSESWRQMIQFPLSATVSIRQLQSQ